MRNAVNYFFIYQLTYAVGKAVPVYLVRHFGDDNLLPSAGLGIHMQLAPDHYPATPGMHGGFYTFHAVDDTTCWEVGRLYMLHQLIYCNVPVINKRHAAVNYFGQVVRHHIR